jgi:hypothetical protein
MEFEDASGGKRFNILSKDIPSIKRDESWGTNALDIREDLVTGSSNSNTLSRAPETAAERTKILDQSMIVNQMDEN